MLVSGYSGARLVRTGAFVKDFVDEAADEVIGALRVLARAPLAQARHAIQQKSLSAKLIYLQRTVPTGDLGSSLWLTGRRVDAAYRDHVQGLVQHTYLTDRAWRVATTPGSLGGMGLRTWADTADAAYLASYAYSRSIVPSLFPRLGPAFANPFVVGDDASLCFCCCSGSGEWAAGCRRRRVHGALGGSCPSADRRPRF